ncbi:MAG: FoF1 ATP synthase subunit a, partial [Rhizomicrobium sp.]
MKPMEQFEVAPMFSQHPLLNIGGHEIYFTNQAFFMCIVVAFASLFLTLSVKKNSLVPSRMQSMAEISYEFVQNMVKSTMGNEGLKFFPFVFTLFMFILFSNFFGLIPYTFTVTSQIAVTLALSC